MSNPVTLTLPVEISTRVIISDVDSGEVLVDKSNAIHSQNMARAIARGLANEANGYIFRMAFGNGGTFRDAGGELVFNPPNDGRDGSWESRLYNETYSEIIDISSESFGTDPGSAEAGNIRPGGGSDPGADPSGGGVVSQEVGTKSNVICTVYLNENEPNGQLSSHYDYQPVGGSVVDTAASCFQFDELGLYTMGAPATATNGYSAVDVNNATSETSSPLAPDTSYTISMTVDGNTYSATIQTPSGGSGPSGQFTYGDICEGINTGAWIAAGDQINDLVYVYITDYSGGTYPTIIAKQSYGFLMFQSKTLGEDSDVVLEPAATFFSTLSGGADNRVNANHAAGKNAGVANDPSHPENERERLLTHLIFNPILKSQYRSLKIVYILTVSVPKTSDSQVQITGLSS